MEYYIVDGELYHHGVKGMKWGVRRYQNKDGSLKPAGKKRYSDSDIGKRIGEAVKRAGSSTKSAAKGAIEKYKAKKVSKKEAERIEALMKKPISKLSSSELAERTALAKKQKELRQIEAESDKLANNAKSFMGKFGSKFLNEAVVPAAVNAGKNALEKFLTKKVSDALGLNEKDTSNALDALKRVKYDYDKLTDAEAKALNEREKNINSAKQSRKQADAVGRSETENASETKPDTTPDPKPNTGGKPKNNKKNSNSNNRSSEAAVEPDRIYKNSKRKSKKNKKAKKNNKTTVYELSDDDIIVRSPSTAISKRTISGVKNGSQYRLGTSHTPRLPGNTVPRLPGGGSDTVFTDTLAEVRKKYGLD